MKSLSIALVFLAVSCGAVVPEDVVETTQAVSSPPPGGFGSQPYVCWQSEHDCEWMPDAPNIHPWRITTTDGCPSCAGTAAIYSGSALSGSGSRVYGDQNTDAEPNGYRFDTDFTELAGFHAWGGFMGDVKIKSASVPSGTMFTACDGTLTGTPAHRCVGTQFVAVNGAATGGASSIVNYGATFTVRSFQLGILTARPANCPYVASGVGRPVGCSACNSYAPSGYPTRVCKASDVPTDSPIVGNIATGEPCFAPGGGVVPTDSVLVYACGGG